jgi:hypothetical protein
VFYGNGTGDRLRTAGSFLVIEGLTFIGVKHEVVGSAIAIRRSEIRNTRTVGVVVSGQGTVLFKNSIHENGDANAATEFDAHGVFVVPGTNYTWVLQNHIYKNGGDGVMVGAEDPNSVRPTNVFISGNMIHEDRENGVDIKRAVDVVVSQNVIYGYVLRSSSSGEAIVVHDDPELVWIVNNVVGASQQGIVCTGANGYYVVGNVVVGIRHNPSYAYDPDSLWGASGILTYNTTNSVHVNNTIWASDAGISIPTGVATEVVNNIAGGLTGATSGIRVADVVRRSGSTVANNIGFNPGFVSTATSDFHLTAGSPAINAGLPHWIFAAFASRYGVPLNRDLYGGTRVVGGAIDIGAVEFQTGSSSATAGTRQ